MGSSNSLSRNGHFQPLLAPWGRGIESPGFFFWLNPIILVQATLPNHKIVEKQPCVDANLEFCILYSTLATAGHMEYDHGDFSLEQKLQLTNGS